MRKKIRSLYMLSIFLYNRITYEASKVATQLEVKILLFSKESNYLVVGYLSVPMKRGGKFYEEKP